METSAISLRQVAKDYGGLSVVAALDLEVAAGEFLVLLGPSGCGKSTILKLIAGIEAPSAGEIHVGGKLVNYTLPRDRDVAMVFQNYALYPHKTVLANIAYPLQSRRKPRLGRAEIAKRAQAAAASVEITSQLAKYPDALSGGQRQRVALARAIVRDPAAFLMDEPLSNLDAQLRDAMRQQLIGLHQRLGKATIYVTHDQLEAMTMATRVVVINEGRIQQAGTAQQVFHAPANLFVAGFVGHPRMNFLQASSAGGNRVRLDGCELLTEVEVGAPGRPLTVGLRPTDGQVDAGDANAIKGQVVQTEFTGADVILTLKFGSSSTLRLRSSGRRQDASGQQVAVAFSPGDVHVFDAAGLRL